ncbi:hypothetical protein ES708_17351 [subsurface metagenome]
MLYLTPILGEIARPVGLNLLGQLGVDFRQLAPRIVIDNLGQLAGADKGQGTDTLAYQFGEQVGRLAVSAAAYAPR